MQLLGSLCASSFVCPSHMCHIHLLRHLSPWQCLLALGGLVRPWWGTGIVLEMRRRGAKLLVRPVPSQCYPIWSATLFLALGKSSTDPTGTQTSGRTIFLIDCISYSSSRDCNPKGESSCVTVAVLVQAGGTGESKITSGPLESQVGAMAETPVRKRRWSKTNQLLSPKIILFF